MQVDSLQVHSLLASFIPATVDEVRKITMSSPNKSCHLDPLLTTLLKACLDTLLYPIRNIVNASLCSGLFPDDFKQAQVNTLLKVAGAANVSVDFFLHNMLGYTELNINTTKNRPALTSYFANPSFKNAVLLEMPLSSLKSEMFP